ncbi:MAG: MFS transporter [Chloroflexota bacterium]
MAARTTLTDVEKINKLPWMVAGDAFNTGFMLLALVGPTFLLFLDELGLDSGQIGIMLSLVPFFGILSPLIGPIVARYGYKGVFLTFRTIRLTILSLILLTPFIQSRFGPTATFLYVATIIAGFALGRAVSETAAFPWYKMVIPNSIRGKFGALGGMVSTVISIIASLVSSFIIDAGETGLNRFIIVYGIAIGTGILSMIMYAQVPAEDQTERAGEVSDFGELRQALFDPQFFKYLMGVAFVSIGGVSIISFIPLYMEKVIGLSEGQVVILSAATFVGSLLTSYLWGWTADRYGSKPIMQSGIVFMWLLPIAWSLLPRNSVWSLPLALTVSFLTGVATLAWQIGWTRYIYNETPEANKTPYMTLFFAWWGASSGIGPLLAGQVLNATVDLEGSWWHFHINPYTPLFIISFSLLSLGFIIISRLRPGDDTSFARFTGMFLRGNMIRGLESLIQFNFAGEEEKRMLTTERMGDARSPFSHNELIEALSDPSFNVRYQAIHSISRMKPDQELVDALIDMLDDEPSELSFTVTRALGRLGDKRAVKPLRSYLSSGFHLLEANSARALAMLGDRESVPILTEKLRAEPNPTLRVAYAAALGKLGGVDALPDLFSLLREVHVDVQRGEIGLAIARMTGNEEYFAQQWRLLRANPSTATAQAILALQRHTQDSHFQSLSSDCANHFAERELDAGVAVLKEMLVSVPIGRISPIKETLLVECGKLLREFGSKRLEYILLALHALDITLKPNGNI